MTREQIIAHFELHDWEPKAYIVGWAGVWKEGRGLVYYRHLATAFEVVGTHHADSFSLVSNVGVTWVELSYECLSEIFCYIREKGL